MCAALGAIGGTIAAALLGNWLNRRPTYALLCLGSLAAALALFRGNDHYGPLFLLTVFLGGAMTASFYGWFPLYLPELFRTSVRATGQGFSYNFGRIIAAVGALQTGTLMGLFKGDYPKACSLMSLVYLAGLVIIWFAPETRGKPLPE
ncbi:MAG: MFS transporter [Planctomycetota bacterium]|nr:MAG: MFS transporter [Planctomycetota bacterium]